MRIQSLSNQPARVYTKQQQLYSKPVKETQRQKGSIKPSVRTKVEKRSQGICEVRERCNGARATEQAHLRGRRLIDETTPEMLRHVCKDCHLWLDETPEGIRYKRSLIRGE